MPLCFVCVCPSRSWILSKPINISSTFFSPSGSQAILVFHYQTVWQYSDRNPPNGGIECRWGRQKSRFWANIWLHCVHVCCVKRSAASAVNLAATNHTEYITLVAGERPSLLMASWQETTTKCMTKKPQRYAEDNVTQWLIWNLSNNNKKTQHKLFCWG